MDLIQSIYEYLGTDEAQAIRQQFVVDERARYTARVEAAAKKLAESKGVQYGGLFKDADGNFYNEQARAAYEQLHREDS